MAHQRDLTDSWPPAALVEYLRASPNEVSVSVLPRPRSTLPGGLIYLTQDEVLAQLAAGVGIDVGYGGRRENDLGVAGEFSTDIVAELAIAVGGGLATQLIESLIRIVVQRLNRELRTAREADVTAQ